MNSTVSEIVLDINAVGSQTSLAMRQYDNKRLIKATLREDGLPYEISQDCRVVFAATKPDNTVIFNNARFEDNVICYDITQQTTAAVGRVKCEFRVYDLENHILTSPAFEIIVDQTAAKDIQIESTNEVNTLTQLIAEATQLIADVNASLDSGGFTPTFAIGTVESLPSYEEAKVTLSGTQKNPILNFGIPRGGNGSEVNHNLLLGLDLPNQHPISAVTGLQAALDGKQSVGNYAKPSDIPTQLSELKGDITHRTVSDAEKADWNAKLAHVPADSVGPDELSEAGKALFAPAYTFGTSDKTPGSPSNEPEGTIYWVIKEA